MPIDADSVIGKAQASIAAIAALPAKQKGESALLGFGEDYNSILELAKEAAPEIDARLWPKPLAQVPNHPGATTLFTSARYVEIEAYLRQIINLLS